MDNERRLKLQETMKRFNKDQKKPILDFANNSKDRDVIATGIKKIDDLIGGGTKKGNFGIVWGGESVGKSTLVLQQIANAQRNDSICCYIDLEHSFEKTRAVTLGVNLDDLILVETANTAEQALEIIRVLCKDKVVDYFAIDSVQAMSPINEQENKGKERQLAEKEIAELARTLGKFFRVVAPIVFNAKASVVMVGQVRTQGIGTFFTRSGLSGGKALLHWANMIMFMRRGQGSDAPVTKFKRYFMDKDNNVRYKTESRKIGYDAVCKLEKTKNSDSMPEGSEIHVAFDYSKGFVDEIETQDSIPIIIEGEGLTAQQKAIIGKELIEKGILKPEIALEDIEEEIKIDPEIADMVKEEIKDLSKIMDTEEAEKEIKKLEKPVKEKKKRGRPKKEKKDGF